MWPGRKLPSGSPCRNPGSCALALPSLCRIEENRYWKLGRFLFRRVPLAACKPPVLWLCEVIGTGKPLAWSTEICRPERPATRQPGAEQTAAPITWHGRLAREECGPENKAGTAVPRDATIQKRSFRTTNHTNTTNQKRGNDHQEHQDTKRNRIAWRRVNPFGRSLTQRHKDTKCRYEILGDSAALRENQKTSQPLENLRGQVLPSISSAEKNSIRRFHRFPQIPAEDNHESREYDESEERK